MGNICQRSSSHDVTPSSGPEDFSVTHRREPIAHPARPDVFSIGRGGTGNIQSLSHDPNSPANAKGAEHGVISEDVASQDAAVYSSGGGGESSASHRRGENFATGPIELTNAQIKAVQAFQSLIDRSIAAWQTIRYVGPERGEERLAVINITAMRLRSYHSLEEVLKRRGYWFFHLREPFLQQKVFLKWDPTRLDEYILLPISYGFVNKQDCFFVSHYWLTKEHPDPHAVDLVQIQQDLQTQEWSYVWVDWTCVPQVPRTELQQKYFNRMLQYIPMLVRDCGFEWRFPAFEPRGWILYEVAEHVLSTNRFTWTDDNRPFIQHVLQMLKDGVRPVVEKYGYQCTQKEDFDLLVGFLELLILLAKILPHNITARRVIRDIINEPYVGSVTDYDTGIEIDKAKGVISYQGKTYRFTPVFHLTSDK